MRTDTPQTIRLEDYRPSDFLIDHVDLDISLHPSATRVKARYSMRRNPLGRKDVPLILDQDGVTLLSVSIDDVEMQSSEFTNIPSHLTISRIPQNPFQLALHCEIDPTSNTQLMGLYRSNGIYCTQCEAEGFRRIVPFLDRPDVLSVYTTRLEADREEAPVLLANGDLIESGAIAGTNRHYALWHDPHPKPCYLFALVGGKLAKISKPFTTMNGRPVEIAVYVEPGKEDRAGYALNALERSMLWDERTFGREYDLSVFNIVAVSDFNMGAMENKGLNIFNDKYILASPETATDLDYANIEAIVAHEYFHNWSGNRVTCRDWFQLCLKEGLTVFRDQEFSSDERSRAVHRISEIKILRTRQFLEDSGPLAHSVRPKQYREINNFYTATVYEKGAEIVRMLKTILGEEMFRQGMDLYFERCDGTAATVEDFLSAFSYVSGQDLSHFAQWYEQAGTPEVTAHGVYDEAKRTYRLDFQQKTSPTPGQPKKQAMAIPVALGLISKEGKAFSASCEKLSEKGVFLFDREADSLIFTNVESRPIPSLFRELSAPVKLRIELPLEDLLAQIRHDTDPFNRWQAAQDVALRLLVNMAGGKKNLIGGDAFADALVAFVDQEATRDPAFCALLLNLPSETDIAQEIGKEIDPDAIWSARQSLKRLLGTKGEKTFSPLRGLFSSGEVYNPDAANAGRRALSNAVLDLLAARDESNGVRLAQEQLANATNMTDRMAALQTIAFIPGEAREAALKAFAERYQSEPLVLDKWFTLQAIIPEAKTLERVKALMRHPTFSLNTPNRVRALIGAFATLNKTQFNRSDGAGYDFVADIIMQVDDLNPQGAARLANAFAPWRSMNAERRVHAERAQRRILEKRKISKDLEDILQRSLAE